LGNREFVAGLDLGSATTKAVVLDGAREIVSMAISHTGGTALESGEQVLEEVLTGAGLRFDDLSRLVTTGYGRRIIEYPSEPVPEIICHAAGAFELNSDTRTVVDIGGQDSKVIAVSDMGTVTDFAMNDKCAAGTGRFLELMAHMLRLPVNDIGPVSLRSSEPCSISSTCAVFAETEVINLRSQGVPVENLLAGAHAALSHRIAIMGSRVKFRERVVLTGGVAQNVGVKLALEQEIGVEVWVPAQPQFVGALGAALIALDGTR
jgi:predicted CoA-substrate-specific enzyme activase